VAVIAEGEQGFGLDTAVRRENLEFVVIDTETTGLYKNDRIIEIGLLAFKGQEIIAELSTLINPLRDVGKTSLHGITASMVSMAPTFADVANEITRFLDGRVLVAHNLAFDGRMLTQELGRLDIRGNLGRGFCTMVAARRRLPLGLASLAEACKYFDIPVIDAHNALADAVMTKEIFDRFYDNEEVDPALFESQGEERVAILLSRSAFNKKPTNPLTRMQTITCKVPFPTSSERGIAYLQVLSRALEDLVLSVEEKGELDEFAHTLGLSPEEIRNLNSGYLDSFIQAALRDGVITSQEREMIDSVANALELHVPIPEAAQVSDDSKGEFRVGSRVCFTGEALGGDGMDIGRSELEALAAKFGLVPVSGVSKKGCDMVIAADVSSMSGKAKKAKEYGIPVIDVPTFLAYCSSGRMH
jgi:DNA polymerase-3 subunit epsilon